MGMATTQAIFPAIESGDLGRHSLLVGGRPWAGSRQIRRPGPSPLDAVAVRGGEGTARRLPAPRGARCRGVHQSDEHLPSRDPGGLEQTCRGGEILLGRNPRQGRGHQRPGCCASIWPLGKGGSRSFTTSIYSAIRFRSISAGGSATLRSIGHPTTITRRS